MQFYPWIVSFGDGFKVLFDPATAHLVEAGLQGRFPGFSIQEFAVVGMGGEALSMHQALSVRRWVDQVVSANI